MMDSHELNNFYLKFESRLSKTESAVDLLAKNLSEIRKDIRWMLRLFISFGTTIIGLLIKGVPLHV